MIYVNYTKILERLPIIKSHQLLTYLPDKLVEKNLSFKKWQDQHRNLFGLLLLIDGLAKFGLDKSYLSKIKYGNLGKPLFDDSINFNISHSGIYAVCAISNDTELGIDIEEIKKIEFEEFKGTMTESQWQKINIATKPLDMFYKYWSMKESALKADSRGLSIPLLEIEIDSDSVICHGKRWHLSELNIDNDYSSFLATKRKTMNVEVKYISFY